MSQQASNKPLRENVADLRFLIDLRTSSGSVAEGCFYRFLSNLNSSAVMYWFILLPKMRLIVHMYKEPRKVSEPKRPPISPSKSQNV